MYESESSTESDPEIIGTKKWMPVELPENFDPKKVPTTGLEYLHYTIYEARKCKTVAVADIDPSKFKQLCTVTPVKDDGIKTCKSMLPTQTWQNQKVEEFTELRNYIQQKLPRLTEGCSPVHLHWIEKIDQEYPKFSVVSHFNVYAQLKLLELVVNKLKLIQSGSTISDTVGVWIHSILTVIEIPLYPDFFAVLREIARQCAVIRSKLPEGSAPEKYTHLNYLICIIGVYFKQFDLADTTN